MAIIYTYPVKTKSASRSDLILISDSEDKNKTKQISVAKLPGGIDFVGVGGNGTAGKIPKWSTQYDLTDSSIFEDSVTGNIGIGTNIPNAELDIQGANVPVIKLTETATGGKNFLIGVDTSNSFLRSSGNLLFQAGPQYKGISILETGEVGIGTTTPAHPLDVEGKTRSKGLIIYSIGGVNAGNTTIVFDNTLATKQFSIGAGIVQNTQEGFAIRNVTDSRTDVYIDNTGNFGIGTYSPNAKLEVIGNYKQKAADANIGGFTISINSGTDAVDLNNYYNAPLTFSTNNAEKMRINGNGNVGIGTTAPDSILTVKAATANVGIPVIKSSVNGFANGFTLIGDDYVAGESQFNLGISYSGANGVLSRSVKVSNTTDDVFLSSQDAYSTNPSAFILDRDGSFRFLNTSTNASTPVDTAVSLSERTRIDKDGNVGIGTTTPTARLHVSKDNVPDYGYVCKLTSTSTASQAKVLTVQSSFSVVGDKMFVYSDGDLENVNGAYGTIGSDERLKENIIDAKPKLNDILSLKVKNFNFIDNDKKQIGFIAQEFEKVFPSLVKSSDTRVYKTHDENGVLLEERGELISGYEDARSLKVGMEFAIITKVIQEQQEIIENLKQRIEQLEITQKELGN